MILIDRYLTRELALTFVAVNSVLLVIYVTVTLTRLLAQGDSGMLTGSEIADITLWKSLIALEVLTPIALYIAIIMVFARLHQDYEFHVMGAAGIGESRLLRPVLVMAGIIAVGVWSVSNQVRPWCWNQIYDLRYAAEQSAEIERIGPGAFHSFDDDTQTVFINAVSEDRSELSGIFVYGQKDSSLQVIASEHGTFEPYAKPDHHRLTLREAHVYRRSSEGSQMTGQFGSLSIMLRATSGDLPEIKEKSKYNPELSQSSNPVARAELQWRHSTPVSTLLLALAAVPLARSAPRQSRYSRLIIALLAYVAYYNVLGLARNAVEQGDLTSLWWAPAAMALTVATLHALPTLRQRLKPIRRS